MGPLEDDIDDIVSAAFDEEQSTLRHHMARLDNAAIGKVRYCAAPDMTTSLAASAEATRMRSSLAMASAWVIETPASATSHGRSM